MTRFIVQQVAGELVDVASDIEAEERLAGERMKSNCAGNQCALFMRQKDKAQILGEIASDLRLRAHRLKLVVGIADDMSDQRNL